MAWSESEDTTNPPVGKRGIQISLPAISVLETAGYRDFDFWTKLRLGLARLFGQMEPVDKLPTEIQGVRVHGQDRLNNLINFLHPFVTRPGFGTNPQDAQDVLDALQKRSIGLGPTETEQASKLQQIYRQALRKRDVFDVLGLELPEDNEPPYPGSNYLPQKGLVGFMRKQQRDENR